MNGLRTWFKKKIAILSLALANVEKNAFSQKGEQLESDINKVNEKDAATLLHSLKNAVVTQEVENLRWRMYKILREIQNTSSEIIGYDNDGMPIVKTKKTDNKSGLRKVNLEPSDNYTLEMVVDNSEIIIGGNDAMANDYIKLLDEVEINYNDEGEPVSASHGEISGNEYFASHKTELPIIIERDTIPKFELEKYTKKLHIRKINDSKRLLEFYVSMYPDEFIRTTRLFISDIKKAMVNPNSSTILDIKKVGFITYKTIGVNDFLEYKYDNLKFEKIVEFNGHYVLKFSADIETNGLSILEEYRVKALDKKYDDKVKK